MAKKLFWIIIGLVIVILAIVGLVLSNFSSLVSSPQTGGQTSSVNPTIGDQVEVSVISSGS